MEVKSIFLRKRGNKYHVMCEYRTQEGKRTQKSLCSCTSSRQANKDLALYKAKYLQSEFILPKKLSLGEYLSNWLDNRNDIGPTTYDRYKIVVNEINACIGKIELQKVLPVHINDFYNNNLSRLSGKTKQIYHKVLNKAFKDAYKHQYINKNIMDFVDTPKGKKFTGNFLSDTESQDMIQSLENTMYEVPVTLAITLGLRISEICGLKWNKVNFENNTITIDTIAVWHEKEKKLILKEPKSEAGKRVLTCPVEVVNLLKKHKIQQAATFPGTELVFTNAHGKITCARSFHTQFRNFIRRHNLPDIRFHDLRHTNASIMLLAGVDIKTASKRLGHSEIGITMNTYTHVLAQLEKEASDKIENVIYKKARN